MQCSKCNSENTQRLEVIYEGGTNIVNLSTSGVGLGGDGFGVGSATTSGVTQSTLASKSSPPIQQKISFIGNCFLWILGITLLPGLGGTGGSFVVGLISLSFLIYLGRSTYKKRKFNSDIWPQLYQDWKNSWMCHKCGHIFHHHFD
jgi:hypothetical protein